MAINTLIYLLAEKTERQDLAALDCLLAKAQRIRETQTKVCRSVFLFFTKIIEWFVLFWLASFYHQGKESDMK